MITNKNINSISKKINFDTTLPLFLNILLKTKMRYFERRKISLSKKLEPLIG